MLGYVIGVRVTARARVRVRFRIKLRAGCSDYNLATLQSLVLKFRTDASSVLERLKRLCSSTIVDYLYLKNQQKNLKLRCNIMYELIFRKPFSRIVWIGNDKLKT